MFHSVDRHDHRCRQSRVEEVLQERVVDETDASVAMVTASVVGKKKQ